MIPFEALTYPNFIVTCINFWSKILETKFNNGRMSFYLVWFGVQNATYFGASNLHAYGAHRMYMACTFDAYSLFFPVISIVGLVLP